MGIKVNKAKCLLCYDVAESTHRHHLRHCKCGAMFVDGGKAYLRRGAHNLDLVEEMSEYEDDL